MRVRRWPGARHCLDQRTEGRQMSQAECPRARRTIRALVSIASLGFRSSTADGYRHSSGACVSHVNPERALRAIGLNGLLCMRALLPARLGKGRSVDGSPDLLFQVVEILIYR